MGSHIINEGTFCLITLNLLYINNTEVRMSKKISMLIVLVLSVGIFSCSNQFAGSVWVSKYDYKEYQETFKGTDKIEFIDSSTARGTFSNPGLPPSVYTFDYTVEDQVITLKNRDLAPRVFTLREGKLYSEDGKKIYTKQQSNQ